MNYAVVVPTRSRPEQCKRLIESFEKTTDDAHLVFVTDDDDNSYDDFDWRGHGVGEMKPRANLVQKLNYTVQNLIDNVDEVMWVGDDHEFITPHWDTKMLLARNAWGPGWLYPNNHRRSDVPESWSTDVATIRSTGWYAPPFLNHYYVDNAIAELGKRAALIRWVPEVEIVHHHYSVDTTTEYDELYRETEKNYGQADLQVFQQWRGSSQIATLVSKLRRELNPDVQWVLSTV